MKDSVNISTDVAMFLTRLLPVPSLIVHLSTIPCHATTHDPTFRSKTPDRLSTIPLPSHRAHAFRPALIVTPLHGGEGPERKKRARSRRRNTDDVDPEKRVSTACRRRRTYVYNTWIHTYEVWARSTYTFSKQDDVSIPPPLPLSSSGQLLISLPIYPSPFPPPPPRRKSPPIVAGRGGRK